MCTAALQKEEVEVSGLRLEGRVCSMLTVMLVGDLDVATQSLNLGSESGAIDVHSC